MRFAGIVVFLFGCAGSASAQPMFAPPPKVSAVKAGAALSAPTLVTLHYKDALPKDVFKDLVKQAGLGLSDYQTDYVLRKIKTVSVDYEKQPFWQVVRDLTTRLDLGFAISLSPRFDQNARGSFLELKEGRDPLLEGPAQMHGGFLVIASNVARSAALSPKGTLSADQKALVDFVVLVDPKLPVRDGLLRGYGMKVTAEGGEELKVVEKFHQWVQDVSSPFPMMWKVRAAFEAPPGLKTATLKAELLGFICATKTETWEIPDILKAEAATKVVEERTRFHFQGVVKVADPEVPKYVVTLASSGKGEVPDFGWPPRTQLDLVRSVRLADAKGQNWLPVAWERKGQSLQIRFRPEPGASPVGEPAKLIWELPIQVVDIQVPIQFANLPIP